MNKIVVYDFDGTFFFTPEQFEGEKIYKDATGFEWPYNGWWGRKESLDTNIFYIPINQWVYKKYLYHKSDSNTYNVLATGRLERLRDQVQTVLDIHDIDFDEVHLNPGMDTYHFKTKLFESLIYRFKPNMLVMYDDRHEHLAQFRNWAKLQSCEIRIIDITKSNKEEEIFYNK